MEPVAIIGMACRFPGAQSLSEFWDLLRGGGHGITPVPDGRWDVEALYSPDAKQAGKINSRFGGFIPDIDLFDAGFFGISPREAVQMDPQQRILLELSHEALEDAGLLPSALAGSDAGVFVGLMGNDYFTQHQAAADFRNIDVHTGSGAGYGMTANRISYHFDLHGPSMAVDSACSSSLVATYMACQSLWSGQSELALAAGVNLMLSPALNVFYAKGGLAAPDGKCKTMSADADGIGRGEGAGVVVLKPLSQAERDGDRIYALIRGGAVNQDGRSNGVTAPNRWAQERLLRTAYRHAGVSPGEVQYVELHGTGTLIGDPIEAKALGAVLADGRPSAQKCLVGSVKGNLGHLEGAAGVAGLIKLALSLTNRQIPPSLWFERPNPHIPFDVLPLDIQQELGPWPEGSGTPLAGVSSFGLGGTNAHLVLETPPPTSPAAGSALAEGTGGYLLTLSARSESALRQLAQRYADLVSRQSAEGLAAVCHAAALRRGRYDYRVSLVAEEGGELAARLSAFAREEDAAGVYFGHRMRSPRRRLVFAYPQLGRIDGGLATGLAQASPAFRDTVRECEQTAATLLLQPPPSLLQRCREGDIDRADPAFPWAHFYLQMALTALWRAAGLEPDAVAAEGLGRAAAHVAAGALDLRQTLSRLARQWGWPVLGNDKGEPDAVPGDPKTPCHTVEGEDFQRVSLPWRRAMDSLLAELSRELGADVLLHGGHPESGTGPTSPEPEWLTVLDGGREHALWHAAAALSRRHDLDWRGLFTIGHPYPRLPSYPWQRTRFWLDRPEPSPAPIAEEDARQRAKETGDAAPGRIRSELSGLEVGRRRPALVGYLRERIAQALRIPPAELDPEQALNGIGIDSLTAVEVKNRIERDLAVTVPVVKFLNGYSIADFADLILAELQVAPKAKAARRPEGDDPALPVQVEALSAQELDDMLRGLTAGISQL